MRTLNNFVHHKSNLNQLNQTHKYKLVKIKTHTIAQLLPGNGYNLGGQNERKNLNPSPLILPGQYQNQNNKKPRNIILPGQQYRKPQSQNPNLNTSIDLDDKDLPPVITQFRPPAGFMDETPQEDPTKNLDIDVMLQRLQAGAGRWYDLAPFLPRLHQNGYDSAIISELTGISPVLQNKWIGSCQIYNSLKALEQVPEETLAYFENSEGPQLLYGLRYLSTEQRITCVNLIVQNNYDQKQCEILARAVKEYERRIKFAGGFSPSAGDCLAFKFYRDAQETKDAESIVAYIQKGLAVATTQGAKDRLNSLIEAPDSDQALINEVGKSLSVIRLEADELGHCPIPVVGELGIITQEVLQTPKTVVEGAFGVFEIPPSDQTQQWVALPMWSALLKTKHPIALSVPDISANKMLMQLIGQDMGSKDKKRLGPGLLIVDLIVQKDQEGKIQNLKKEFFIVKGQEGVLQLTAGVLLGDDIEGVVGQVVFLCRPPKREMAQSGSGVLEL